MAKKKGKKVKKKVGRPSRHRKAYNEQAYKLCLLGATDKELADFFQVSEQTINAWKKAKPEFLESLKRGKVKADAEIADKLFQRAFGYEHPETKVFCHEGEITTFDVVKHYPPDTGSLIIWLKNRQPKWWRDKIENVISGTVKHEIVNFSNVKIIPDNPDGN